MALGLFDLLVVMVASVIPPIVYLFWIRNQELCQRERLGSVLYAFVIGAVLTLGLAFVLESLLISLLFGDGGLLSRPFWFLDPQDATFQLVFLACVMAPLVEEMTKAIGVWTLRRQLTELENGLVYGAAVGLGFAALENILYGIDAWEVGFGVFVGTAVARALSSTFLHASATAVMGYGIAKRELLNSRGISTSVLKYYLIAVLLHAGFNFLAIAGELFQSEWIYLFTLLAAIYLVLTTFRRILSKVESLDAASCAPSP